MSRLDQALNVQLGDPFYRVHPEDEPVVGEIVRCFDGLQNAYTYVMGWHGDTCKVYKVFGHMIHEAHETVGIDYTEDDGNGMEFQNIMLVTTMLVKVVAFEHIGTVIPTVRHVLGSGGKATGREIEWRYVKSASELERGRNICSVT